MLVDEALPGLGMGLLDGLGRLSLDYEFLHHGIVGRLGLALPIEEQRVVHALPRKIVQPALAVVQVPERHAVDDVIILAEESEQLGVLLGLAGEDLGRAAIDVGIDLRHLRAVLVAVGPPAAARDDVDVEFADHDLHTDTTQGDQGLLQRLIGNAINLVVPLEADGMDRRFTGLQAGK